MSEFSEARVTLERSQRQREHERPGRITWAEEMMLLILKRAPEPVVAMDILEKVVAVDLSKSITFEDAQAAMIFLIRRGKIRQDSQLKLEIA